MEKDSLTAEDVFLNNFFAVRLFYYKDISKNILCRSVMLFCISILMKCRALTIVDNAGTILGSFAR